MRLWECCKYLKFPRRQSQGFLELTSEINEEFRSVVSPTCVGDLCDHKEVNSTTQKATQVKRYGKLCCTVVNRYIGRVRLNSSLSDWQFWSNLIDFARNWHYWPLSDWITSGWQLVTLVTFSVHLQVKTRRAAPLRILHFHFLLQVENWEQLLRLFRKVTQFKMIVFSSAMVQVVSFVEASELRINCKSNLDSAVRKVKQRCKKYWGQKASRELKSNWTFRRSELPWARMSGRK